MGRQNGDDQRFDQGPEWKPDVLYRSGAHSDAREPAIPTHTRIWLGHLDEDWHIGMHGTDFTLTDGNKIRLGEGSATTVYMGRFVVQVVTEHVKPEYADPDFRGAQPKPRNWERKLIETWPILSKKVVWPPPLPFTNGGPEGIANLMDRWRMGTPVKAGSI